MCVFSRVVTVPSRPVPCGGCQWCGERVEAVGEYPQQTARLRKERLYLDCIRLFDQGKSWESGIPLCKELAQLYETEVFEYQKLADILVSPVCASLCPLRACPYIPTTTC